MGNFIKGNISKKIINYILFGSGQNFEKNNRKNKSWKK